MHNNLLHPGVIFVPVPCANKVIAFNISCNIPSNITIEQYSSHSLFPFVPVLIHQVVMISDPVYIQIFFGMN